MSRSGAMKDDSADFFDYAVCAGNDCEQQVWSDEKMVPGCVFGIVRSGLPVWNHRLFPDGFIGMEKGREQ